MSALDKIPGGKLVQGRIRALNGKIDAKSEGAEALPEAEKELVAKRIKELSEWVSQRCQKGISLHELALVADAIDRITEDTSVNFAQWFAGVEQSFQGPVIELRREEPLRLVPLEKYILPTQGVKFGGENVHSNLDINQHKTPDDNDPMQVITEHRFDEIILFLQQHDFFDPGEEIFYDEPKPNHARKLPYFIIPVKACKKIILTCNQRGESTFVVDDTVPRDDLTTLKKDDLQAKYSGKIVPIGRFSTSKWKKNLLKALLSQKDYIPLSPQDDIRQKLNNSYFNGEESYQHIREDLLVFAEKIGKPLVDLKANHIKDIGNMDAVKLKNGLVITGLQYLGYAGVQVLSGQFSSVEDVYHGSVADVFNCLREKAGIAGIQDKKYWENTANIKADFDACAKEAGVADASLLTNKEAHLETEFTCVSGQKVTLARYLAKAGQKLFSYKTLDIATRKRAGTLNHLKDKLSQFQRAQALAAE